jgi:hypothetical protein
MNKQSFRISILARSLTIACCVLVSGSLAFGQAILNGRCSDLIVQGDYGFSVEGVVLPAPGVSVPVRGVAMTHFDGAGNLSQVDHIIINGVPPALDWTPGTGTYHVNPDCTGTMRINIPSTGDVVNLRFVVVRLGREIHTVVTAPFNGPARTVTSVGIRQD